MSNIVRTAALAAALALGPLVSTAHAYGQGEVNFGAGFGAFNQDLGDVTSTGFAWNGHVGWMPVPPLGGEIAYEGLSAGTDVAGAPATIRNFDVVQHAVSARARVALPVGVARSTIEPYLLGGLGYSHLALLDPLAFIVQTDDALMVPFGGGVEFVMPGGFLLDGRFTYNLLTGSRGAVVQSGDSWNAALSVGARLGGPY